MDGDLEFRRQLYKISTRLSTDDVSNIKFYCTDDYLPRRQLEAVQSGFHLFCQLLDNGTLSKDDPQFLKELLELVRQKPLFQLLCNRPLQEGHEPTLRRQLLADPVFKPLLKELGDSLLQKQLKDVAYFFSGSALTVQDVEDIKKPEEVFQKLKDSGTHLDTLLMVLEAIGRQDLCDKVRKRCSTVQANTEIAPVGAVTHEGEMPHAGGTAGGRQECYPVEEESGRTDNSLGSSRSHDLTPPMSHDPVTMVFCGSNSIQYRDGPHRGPDAHSSGGATPSQVQMLKTREQALRDKMREASHPCVPSHLLEEIRVDRTEVSDLRERLVQNGDVVLYPMSCRPHGIALVIVNEHFDSTRTSEYLNPRQGAAADQEKLCTLFKSLDYTVECHSDLKSLQMLEAVKRVALRDHSGYDSFVLCVSTHGTETTLYGVDGERVKRRDLFALIKTCGTLKGKPKMFFIQACRTDDSAPHIPPGEVATDGPVELHGDADCFYANAATSQNPAHRDTKEGSWFVTALSSVLSMKATHTLTSMMHHVNALLQEKGRVEGNPPASCLQCAEVCTTCTKDIRF